MNKTTDPPSAQYACPEKGCAFQWRLQDGYFEVSDGIIHYSADGQQFLKPALVREHGYLYIHAIGGSPRKRTWRCAVKDCPNTLIDEI